MKFINNLVELLQTRSDFFIELLVQLIEANSEIKVAYKMGIGGELPMFSRPWKPVTLRPNS